MENQPIFIVLLNYQAKYQYVTKTCSIQLNPATIIEHCVGKVGLNVFHIFTSPHLVLDGLPSAAFNGAGSDNDEAISLFLLF